MANSLSREVKQSKEELEEAKRVSEETCIQPTCPHTDPILVWGTLLNLRLFWRTYSSCRYENRIRKR